MANYNRKPDRSVSPSQHLTFQSYYDKKGRPLERREEVYNNNDYTYTSEAGEFAVHPNRRERIVESSSSSLDTGHHQDLSQHQGRRQSLGSQQEQFASQQKYRLEQEFGKGRGKVGKKKDRRLWKSKPKRQQEHPSHQQQQYQQQDDCDEYPPRALSLDPFIPPRAPASYDSNQSNVNAIQISNARNRLRDRFSPELPPPPSPPPENLGGVDSTIHTNDEYPPASSIELPKPIYRTDSGQLPQSDLDLPDPLEDFSPDLNQPMSHRTNGAPATPTGPAGPLNGPTRTVRRLPNHVQVADAYIFQQTIDDRLKKIGVTHAREDALRLAGVQWIDQVRRALKLPVRTFDTACVYYHKFRLMHGDNEYAFVDASAAALFAACKIEDTLKKSRDILCAAHNLKAPSRADHLSPDDPSFESSARSIIAHERLMLEAAGFDFRSRCPQVVLIKLMKEVQSSEPVREAAWRISLDLYRTMAPLKQCTAALAFACMELAERLFDGWNETVQAATEQKYSRWYIRREMVVETLLDLLDIYTSHRSSTALGTSFPLDKFLEVRIPLNEECARRRLPRYTEYIEPPQAPASGNHADGPGGYGARHLQNGTAGANGGGPGGSGRSSKNTSPKDLSSPASGGPTVTPGTGGSGSTNATSAGGGQQQQQGIRQRASERGREGTVRFMLDPEREREERGVVLEYEREWGRVGGGPPAAGGRGA